MKTIDWSKAPEGTTHAGWTNYGRVLQWYKMEPVGKYNYQWWTGRTWRGNEGTPCAETLIEIPKKEEVMFKKMRFEVSSPEHSAEIQKALFSLGYKWRLAGANVSFSDMPFLFADFDGDILHSIYRSSFENPKYQLCTVEAVTTYKVVETAEPEVVELNGRKYLKADLEAALDKLTPYGAK